VTTWVVIVLVVTTSSASMGGDCASGDSSDCMGGVYTHLEKHS